jgi:transposase
MDKGISYVAMDTGKRSFRVAAGYAGREERVEWEVVNEPAAVKRMVRKAQREAGGEVIFCYEAGPCGYALKRQIEALGVRCVVVAPSLIPVKPGQRIKTDRRDARKLLELFRAGLLTEVWPPTVEEESVRDLTRCREDVLEDLARCRHRLGKMLLRRGYLFGAGRSSWTQSHRRWMVGIRWEREADRMVFSDYLLAVDAAQSRLENLTAQLEAFAQQEPYKMAVGALGCFRGISTVTAMTIVTELHGIERFTSPRQLMAYLGMVPSEYSSSEKVRRGSITNAGNAHVRRVLVEAAHHYRHSPSVGRILRKRREGQPASIVALADKAQLRLHRRYRRLLFRGKPYGTMIVAVARELVGFLWAALQGNAAIRRQAA